MKNSSSSNNATKENEFWSNRAAFILAPLINLLFMEQEENPDYWKQTEKPPQKSRDFMESSDALEAFRAWAQGQGGELPASDHVMLFTG